MDIPVEDLIAELRTADYREAFGRDVDGLRRGWYVRSTLRWSVGPGDNQRGHTRSEVLLAGGVGIDDQNAVVVADLLIVRLPAPARAYVTRIDLHDDAPWRLARVVQRVLREREERAAAPIADPPNAYVPEREWQLGVPGGSVDDESDPVDDWRLRRCDAAGHPTGVHYHPTGVNGKWRTYVKADAVEDLLRDQGAHPDSPAVTAAIAAETHVVVHPDGVEEVVDGPAEDPCPIASSITNQPCLLPNGHPEYSATRFHKYAPPPERSIDPSAGLDPRYVERHPGLASSD